MKARAAVHKALQYTRDRKGFSLVEFLSGCPVNLKMDAVRVNEFIDKHMSKYYVPGVFKDIADSRAPLKYTEGKYDPEDVRKALYVPCPDDTIPEKIHNPSPVFNKERRLKIAGAGGQGVLSFGYMLAVMGNLRKFNVSYLPVYGPEMRGGTASCSVVVSRKTIASPVVDADCDLLVMLNQQSFDRFLPELKPNGILVYDASGIVPSGIGAGQTACFVPASDMARSLGDLRYANSILLGAIAKVMVDLFLDDCSQTDFEMVSEKAIRQCFRNKKDAIMQNIKAFQLGKRKAKCLLPAANQL